MPIHKDAAPKNSLAPNPNEPDEFEIDEVLDLHDMPDGSVEVRMGEDLPEEVPTEFYDNLAFDLDQSELDSIAQDLLQKIEYDKQSREQRDKLYAEGIKRTGLGNEAPGGAQFIGASKAVHPMLMESAVDYEASIIKELFPPTGPAKMQILGSATKARLDKATRKTRYMNWMTTTKMSEFRGTLEQILMQEPLAGVDYLRIVWDARHRRPFSSFAGVDEVYIPFAATDFYSAERITFVDDITELEYKERVRAGLYLDQELVGTGLVPEASKAEKASEKVEGKTESAYNEDGLRRTYECNTFLRLSGDDKAEGEERPYLVYLDNVSNKVMGIVRNWQEKDKLHLRMHWMIEWGFIPWRGAYPIGLTHMIGGLSGAATGALRALLDSAHIQNFPGALKLKGASVGGQSQQVQPTQIQEVTGGVGADDIRKLVMAFPNNGPSSTLFQLLGFLVDTGRGVVQTTFEKGPNGEQPNANMPVGTIMMYIEQGLKVMNALHSRQHASMARTLDVIHRIISMYETDKEIKDDTGEMIAYLADFEGPMDVIPVSDPAIFSEAQRFAQMQAVSQRADAHPEIYNVRNVEKFILERMHIEDPDQFLLPKQQVQEMNAVSENLAMTLGQPVAAFPMQDHQAHMKVLLDYMASPLLGSSVLMAPKFIPAALDHLKEHIAMWYVNYMYEATTRDAQRDISEFLKVDDPEVHREADKLFADTSSEMMQEGVVNQALGPIPAIVQRAIETVQRLMPPTPGDPMVEVEKSKVAQRAQEEANRTQIADKRIGQDRMKLLTNLRDRAEQRVVDIQKARESQKANTDRTRITAQTDVATTQMREMGENAREAAELNVRERMNSEDNQTALAISAAEIESGDRTGLSTGHGINPG